MNFDGIVGSVCRKIDELKLKKKLRRCEEKAKDIKNELSDKVKNMNIWKNKKKAAPVKKTNPVTAVLMILSGIAVLFCTLVAFFYGFYSLVHRKKTSGYIRVSK